MTNIDILTREDFINFKNELFDKIKESSKQNTLNRNWLKTSEVTELLNISTGTLKNLRETGVLPFSKMGGTLFYNHDDIMQILEDNRR